MIEAKLIPCSACIFKVSTLQSTGPSTPGMSRTCVNGPVDFSAFITKRTCRMHCMHLSEKVFSLHQLLLVNLWQINELNRHWSRLICLEFSRFVLVSFQFQSNMRRVTDNAHKHYIRSRLPASSESIKREESQGRQEQRQGPMTSMTFS